MKKHFTNDNSEKNKSQNQTGSSVTNANVNNQPRPIITQNEVVPIPIYETAPNDTPLNLTTKSRQARSPEKSDDFTQQTSTPTGLRYLTFGINDTDLLLGMNTASPYQGLLMPTNSLVNRPSNTHHVPRINEGASTSGLNQSQNLQQPRPQYLATVSGHYGSQLAHTDPNVPNSHDHHNYCRAPGESFSVGYRYVQDDDETDDELETNSPIPDHNSCSTPVKPLGPSNGQGKTQPKPNPTVQIRDEPDETEQDIPIQPPTRRRNRPKTLSQRQTAANLNDIKKQLGKLPIAALRRYRDVYKLNLPANAKRTDLLRAIKEHFTTIQVDEKEIIERFVVTVTFNVNKLEPTDRDKENISTDTDSSDD